MEKILTVPTAVEAETVYVTGNHHVSLPHIDAEGRLLALSHLSRAGGALVEYTGGPLLQLQLDGQALCGRQGAYTHSFMPTFCAQSGPVEVQWKYYAPQGIRGFVVRVQLAATVQQTVRLALVCTPGQLMRSLFHSRPLKAQAAYGVDAWTGAAAVEYTAGFGITALAISGGRGFDAQAQPGRLVVAQEARLLPGESTVLEFYLALGAEQDGACLANMDMRRRAGTLYRQHAALLDGRARTVSDPVLQQRLNLNLNFCYYFSLGYPLDDDTLMLMTSKSSRYYVSGAYWARDSFLWAFPAILRVDAAMAREMLLAAFTTYLKQGANHALYLNGANLYPGFELDELVAPLIALKQYVARTQDEGILRLPVLRDGAAYILKVLEGWKDPDTGLYHTELNPSDDPVGAPCLVYNNALVLAALQFCAAWLGKGEGDAETLAQSLKAQAAVPMGDGSIYAWAVGGKPPEIYDDPPGSLLLMPRYGWPDKNEATYQNTVAHYFSRQNPYFYQSGALMARAASMPRPPGP